MRQSPYSLRSWRARTVCLLVAIFAAVTLQPQASIAAQAGYEVPPVLSASRILPPELLSGENFRVRERVVNDGFMNTYVIDSPFGTFTAVSTALLRKRIQEIKAMTAMEKLKGTKEFADSFKASGLSALTAAKDMVFRPVKTLDQAVTGVGLLFRRAGDSLFGSKRSDAEDSRFKNLIGFSNYKREYAYDLGVDVYSRNQVLQDKLNDIAWVGFAGGLTVSAAMAAVPGGAGIAMTAIGTTRLTTAIFKNTPPSDLRRMNTEKLNSLGIDPSTTELFINNPIFTPREQTDLVAALAEMPAVASRENYVQLAALTNNADMAFFRQRQTDMYAGYHKAITPLTEFVSLGQLVAARAENGILVFNVPVDYLVWTEAFATMATKTNSRVSETPGVTQKQLWVTGTLSPRARAEMQRMNWKVYERADTLVVATENPSYQKQDNRTPSATLTLKSKSIALGAGVSWGDGVLTYQGKDYPFSVSQLSLLDLGVSSVTGSGKVYNLNNLADFSGNYVATQATFAVRGGSGELTMINAQGVSITLTTEQSRTQLTAGPAGVELKLK